VHAALRNTSGLGWLFLPSIKLAWAIKILAPLADRGGSGPTVKIALNNAYLGIVKTNTQEKGYISIKYASKVK
jgi:hypothetical protein